MVKLCCVQNCGSKSPDPDGNKRTLFTVPTDANRRDEWMAKIVPHLRKGKNRRKILYICDKHFKEDDIEWDFTVILTNGSVCNVGPRQFAKLKPKSVPCIFEYLGFSPNPEICVDCTEQLKVSYVFKTKCLNTEKVIGNYLQHIRCTARSVELQEIVSYLDDESKEASEMGQDNKNTAPNAQDIISEWEDSQDVESEKAASLVALDVRQSAPNPTTVQESEIISMNKTHSFKYRLSDTIIPAQEMIKMDKLTNILKGAFQNEATSNSASQKPKTIQTHLLNDVITDLPKITSVFSLNEEMEKPTISENIELPEPPTTDGNLDDTLAKRDPVIVNDDSFIDIKDEPFEVEINGEHVNFHPCSTDEETLDASETEAYRNDIACDTSVQGIIDNIPEIPNQYVDVPDFVQINNFGPRELEELRRQQLSEEERNEDVLGFQSALPAAQALDKLPEMTAELEEAVKGQKGKKADGTNDLSIPSGSGKRPKYGRRYKWVEDSIATFIEGDPESPLVKQSKVGSQVKPLPSKRRKFRIVPVKIDADPPPTKKKPKSSKQDDKDVVVLFTNYTADGCYINDHDYLVNPYKRNKILVETGTGSFNERLLMCYICHELHQISDHVTHMMQHGSKCEMCFMDLGTPYMLNVHVRCHTKPCRLCTEKVPYGMIKSHARQHVAEEEQFEESKSQRRKKADKDEKPVYFALPQKNKEEGESLKVLRRSTSQDAESVEIDDNIEQQKTGRRRGRKRNANSEESSPEKRILRSRRRRGRSSVSCDEKCDADGSKIADETSKGLT